MKYLNFYMLATNPSLKKNTACQRKHVYRLHLAHKMPVFNSYNEMSTIPPQISMYSLFPVLSIIKARHRDTKMNLVVDPQALQLAPLILLLNQNFKENSSDRSNANFKIHWSKLNACLPAIGNRKTASCLLSAWFCYPGRGTALKQLLNLRSNCDLKGHLSVSTFFCFWQMFSGIKVDRIKQFHPVKQLLHHLEVYFAANTYLQTSSVWSYPKPDIAQEPHDGSFMIQVFGR